MKNAILLLFLMPISSVSYSNNASELYPSNKIDIVLNEAESYLGVRWKMGGTTRKTIDCSALVQNSFKAAGFNIPRTSRSQHGWDRGIKLKKKAQYQRGDLLFFSSGGHYVGHVGIVSEVRDGKIHFIHSSSNNKKVAFDILEGHYTKTFVGGRRLFKEIKQEKDDEIDVFVFEKPKEKPSQSRDSDDEDSFEWLSDFSEEDSEEEVIEFEVEESNSEGNNLSFDFRKEERPIRSSRKRLRYDDIKHLDPCEIRILKNTIYARHGYEFHKNPAMKEHFEGLEWYQNIENKSRNEFFIRSQFSVTDKANVAFLKEYEGVCEGESAIQKKLNIKIPKLKKLLSKF